MDRLVLASLASLALALALPACGRRETTEANMAEAGGSVITLKVYSGRAQPPPETTAVRVGAEVTLRVLGLGPARARVFGPDGVEAATRDVPYAEHGAIVGTEQRFVAVQAGQWRLELAEAPGLVLGYLDAR